MKVTGEFSLNNWDDDPCEVANENPLMHNKIKTVEVARGCVSSRGVQLGNTHIITRQILTLCNKAQSE